MTDDWGLLAGEHSAKMTTERIRAIEQACGELAARGEPVTFVAVSQRTRISRAALYRDPALRATVEEHRARARDATTLTGLAAEVASQRLAIQDLADKVRRHDEILAALSPLTVATMV